MFNLSGSEIVVILLLALVVLGPEKLPDALRRAGKTYAELKKMGNSFQSEMKSVLDEPMKEMRDTADLLKKSVDFTDGELGTTKAVPPRVPVAAKEVAAPAIDVAPTADALALTESPEPKSSDEGASPDETAQAAVDAPAVDAPADAGPADAGVDADAPVAAERPALSAEDELINRTLSGER